MSDYRRYAIYSLPADRKLAAFGATWLGWDILKSKAHAQPDRLRLANFTKKPRKYGFHATIKPPFHLCKGHSLDGLHDSVASFAHKHNVITLRGLKLSTTHGFLALHPIGDTQTLNEMAFDCVKRLDVFRAPASDAEFNKRRAAGLNKIQEQNLQNWGYPYVGTEFRMHFTLSQKANRSDLFMLQQHAIAYLPALPKPFCIDAISLVGERLDGMFEHIETYPLAR